MYLRFDVAFLSLVLMPLSLAAVLPRAIPVPPLNDPFYSPPAAAKLLSSTPGTIFRSRQISTVGLFSFVPVQVKAAYQLLYASTDSLGNPSAAVTTILIPNNANFSRVLSYQVATDASFPNCAPSYVLQLETSPVNGGSLPGEELLIIAALDQGWVVNTPDYEGLQSAFVSGIQAGHATLDSVRAALRSTSITGISPKAEYQLWGYSGGSLASEWAAELQTSYAPELKFKGAALGGLVPSVINVLKTVNETPFAGLAPAGIIGLANAYPQLAAFLREQLLPAKAALFNKARTQCLDLNIIDYAGQDLFSFFKDGEATFDEPLLVEILAKTGTMGVTGTPTMPIFAYKAVGDEITLTADTDALVTKLCSQGASITYNRDLVGEHVTEAITASADAFNFLKARFEGVPIAKGCRTNNVVTSLTDPGNIETLGLIVVDALGTVLQQPVGPYGIFL